MYAAVTLFSTFASTAWLSLASRFFGALSVYLLHAGKNDERVVTGASEGKKGKKGKKGEKQYEFPSLAVVKLSRAASYEIKHFSTFDQSVTLLFGIGTNCVATFALSSVMDTRNTMLPGMCVVSFLLCIYNTLNTVFLDQTTSKYERYGLILLFFLGVGSTYWLLLYKSDLVLHTTLEDSVTKTLAAFSEILKKREVFTGLDATKVKIPNHLTATLISVLAGYVSACVFSSALRITQSYNMSIATSQADFHWGAKYLKRRGSLQVVWHTAMVAPLLLACMGPSDGKGAMYAAAVMFVVVAHLAIIRPMLQAFLDRGLVEWYETKHSTDNAETLSALAKYLKSALQRRLYVLGKVSVQGITLPLLLISLVPLNLSLLNRGGEVDVPTGAANLPGQFIWELVASYLLWWGSCNWSVIFLVALYLRRAGVFR
ncbi:hypothetical protein HOP50_04g29630 [Chloropicon primus]|uniref:Transmembrane protein n=1 Tax=Chloropicon primus TaxID=1764295 RepID=A0A5B8MIW0_9CHLO|nr:hypothetical protein A3770_04p29640 [Chloropicon primus]UPQ99655.1 hypothetical protein HOP50_04g29630 [Chloropicon primus]|eukprot:QDZ20446.1 hypothetical protein A3770_04p29640 [Chloropicon primus]